jgi:uncharacterized repeat protein (TIGR01451 family)
MKQFALTALTLIVSASLFLTPAVASGVKTVTPTPTARPTATPTPTMTVVNNNVTNGYGGQAPCQPAYGGGSNCPTQQIVINKTVKKADSNEFVDNLSVNDAKYLPGSTVTFKLTVTNTGTDALKSATVTDVLPANLTYTSGISGATYNNSTKTLTFNAGDFAAGESKTFTLTTTVDSADKLPDDQGVICETNQATVTVENMNNSDTAQFCVEKPTKPSIPVYPTQPTKKTPPTGPETLALFGLIPTALSGLALRRKSSK